MFNNGQRLERSSNRILIWFPTTGYLYQYASEVRNADYEKLELLPLEVGIRDKIGELVEVEDANHISTWLPEFLSDKHFTKMDELIDREYHATLFSTEPSWVNGLKALQDLHGSPFTFSLN